MDEESLQSENFKLEQIIKINNKVIIDTIDSANDKQEKLIQKKENELMNEKQE